MKSIVAFPACQASYNAGREKDLNVIGARIAQARKSQALSLSKFSQLLAYFGVSAAPSTINNWEVGDSTPNAYQLLAITNALSIDDGFAYFQSNYNPPLNNAGMRKLEEYRSDLIATGLYMPELDYTEIIEMPVSILTASAGPGNMLDSDCFEFLPFPKHTIPSGADFGIRVSGNSMEPVFQSGQIVWIKKCDSLHTGQVGLFYYDGEGYLKVYSERNVKQTSDMDGGVTYKQPILLSYNSAYAPIVIAPDAVFQIMGRVVS